MKKTSLARAIRCRAQLALGVVLCAAAGSVLAGACTVSSSGLAFGAYQPLTFAGKLNSVDKTSTATVTVMCTAIAGGGGYSISLGPGTYGPGDRISTRYLANTNGGDYMIFNVYHEASYSTIWGDGITAGSVLGGTLPTGDSNQSHAVYGRIAAGQNTLKAGSFSDSLTMTLTYSP
jgi:spore coat protein U-like protein